MFAHCWEPIAYGVELWLLAADGTWRRWGVAPDYVTDRELAFVSATLQECRTIEDAELLLREMWFLEAAW